jgi:hypothetical protein
MPVPAVDRGIWLEMEVNLVVPDQAEIGISA